MRARLLAQLNQVLVTKDTARGLIVSMPDVLFDFGKSQLKPAARERLARISGIVLAYPDLRLEIEGYTDSIGEHGFSYNGITYSTLDLGTQHFTVATSINNAGQIIGYYGSRGGSTVGFLQTNGRFTNITTSNAVTEPLGINSSGAIVGITGTETDFMSFMFQNGRFVPVTVKVPSSFITQAEGIDDSGEIVGWYLFNGSPVAGFTALP